jgi:phage terminase large subunit
VLVRKTYKSIAGSIGQTFDRVIAGAPVEKFGGEKVEKYIYANGSVLWVGGMDIADKVLSSERDFIFANQAEELELNDWELFTTRTTGRGAVIPYPQTFGDCNPSRSQHWIRQRAKDGKLKLLTSRHTDNPTLYDDAGALTEQGKRTMAVLENLTGVRRLRLLLGQWASAEGAIYEMFNQTVHVIERPASEFRVWHLAIDEGYTNPAVILLVGEDSDGRWHVAREFYERGKLQSDVVTKAKEWFIESSCDRAAVDAAAAGLIADLQNAGVRAEGAKGRVLDGIAAIQNRLKVCGDGRPRLTVSPGCPNTINEFESYEWQAEKDAPQKENDHAADALRYLNALISEPSGGWTDEAVALVRQANPEIHFPASTQPEFDRDAAKQPYRITPGGQNPGVRDLSRMGKWTPRR